MDQKNRREQYTQRISPFMPALVSFAVALTSALCLFNTSAYGNLTSIIIDIGLDQLRSELIAALLVTVAAALSGACVGRRKLGAAVGATIVFSGAYLAHFMQLELQPVYDPGGLLEPLNTSGLLHTVVVMLALALLCAFIGSAIGVALSEVIFNPFLHLWQFLRRSPAPVAKHSTSLFSPFKQSSSPQAMDASSILSSWSASIAVIALILLASGSADLFIFAPDVGLHTLPLLRAKHAGAPVQGAIVHDELASRALGGQIKPFLVYLPPSYNSPAGRAKRYPTLYLLHGSPGKGEDWLIGGKVSQSADTLIALGKIPELIMVFPDGNGRQGATSEWANSFDRRQMLETYVASDMVKYVDHKYRTLSEKAYRGIGGLSMGGFGAMNIAVHHPDVFGTVISLGGYYLAEGSIWGNNTPYMRANSPLKTLVANKNAWKLRMYIGAATRDQPYYSDARQFAQELHRLHISYHFDIQAGYHAWKVWQVQLYNALLWLNWG